MPSNPEIAAAIVVGNNRARAQEALDALYAQSMRDRMEIVVVDLGQPEAASLETSSAVSTRYVRLGPTVSWGHGRAEAVRLATAPVVAFIEDHCTADRKWAEAVARAYAGGWAAVSYAFTNPHGGYYVARAIMAAEYGCWAHPARSRQTRVLPSGNVSYRRDRLLAMEPDLETLLTPDFGVHERFNQQGLGMYVEGAAMVAHDSLGTIPSLVSASFLFCRILAARRAETQRWNAAKRIAYGLATPIVAPAIAFWRLIAAPGQSTAGRMALVGYLPVLAIKFVSSAAGESLGYLAGMGPTTEAQFGEWELHIDRAPHS